MRIVAVVALEVHKKFSEAVALDGGAEVLDDWRIAHGHPGEMAAFLGQTFSSTGLTTGRSVRRT